MEDGRVGIGVAGTGVGEGPSVGGGPAVSAITVLITAVISMGVDSPGVDSPLPGMIGPHAERNTTRIIVKAIIFFIEASYPEDFRAKQNVPLYDILRSIAQVA